MSQELEARVLQLETLVVSLLDELVDLKAQFNTEREQRIHAGLAEKQRQHDQWHQQAINASQQMAQQQQATQHQSQHQLGQLNQATQGLSASFTTLDEASNLGANTLGKLGGAISGIVGTFKSVK